MDRRCVLQYYSIVGWRHSVGFVLCYTNNNHYQVVFSIWLYVCPTILRHLLLCYPRKCNFSSMVPLALMISGLIRFSVALMYNHSLFPGSTANSATLNWYSPSTYSDIEYGLSCLHPDSSNYFRRYQSLYPYWFEPGYILLFIYARSDCGASAHGQWVGPYVFTTSCNNVPIPFTEGFSGTTFPTRVLVQCGCHRNGIPGSVRHWQEAMDRGMERLWLVFQLAGRKQCGFENYFI